MSGFEKRAHPRVAVQVAASVTAQQKTYSATVANLSRGGALLVAVPELAVGSGVRISFVLSGGLPVNLSGKVVRRDGSGGFGVQFFELDDVTREILDDHLLRFGNTDNSALEALVSVKYHVEQGPGRVTLTLSGFLDKSDCVDLRGQMEKQVPRAGRNLVLILDATRFVCCAPDGLKDFTAWLSAFAVVSLTGGLVGPRSVGVLQLRRAVRDAQIADAFMAFDTVAEADEAFAHLSDAARRPDEA